MSLIKNTTVKYLIRKWVFTPGILVGNLAAYLMYKLSPSSWWNLNGAILVIGCPRSGTTIFEELFREHEDLASWTEAGQIFQPRYYGAEEDHLYRPEDLTGWDEARIKVFFKLRTVLTGKRRFVNKNPRNSLRIPYLLALYPDAYFIHVIRDGRAVVNSNDNVTQKTPFRRKLPFGGFCKPPEWRRYVELDMVTQFAHQWIDILDVIEKDQSALLDAAHYTEIRYEDFCEDVHGHLARLDLFCKLDPERRLRDRIPKQLQPQNMKWRSRLKPEQVANINNITLEGLKRFDYPA